MTDSNPSDSAGLHKRTLLCFHRGPLTELRKGHDPLSVRASLFSKRVLYVLDPSLFTLESVLSAFSKEKIPVGVPNSSHSLKLGYLVLSIRSGFLLGIFHKLGTLIHHWLCLTASSPKPRCCNVISFSVFLTQHVLSHLLCVCVCVPVQPWESNIDPFSYTQALLKSQIFFFLFFSQILSKDTEVFLFSHSLFPCENLPTSLLSPLCDSLHTS